MDIKDWFNDICNVHGQKVVAAAGGITQDQVSRIKNNGVLETLSKIMNAFDVTIVTNQEQEESVTTAVFLARQIDRLRKR